MLKTDPMPTDRKIKKAIVKLQSIAPFFGYLALNVKMHEINKNECPTVGVDHDFNLYYNKEWIENEIEDHDMLIGIMCHETLHVALNHIGRTGRRHKNISNIAQDMVVNMITVKSGMKLLQGKKYVNVNMNNDTAWVDMSFAKVPKKIVIYNVSDKSWERVYEEIIKQIENQGESGESVEKNMEGEPAFSVVFDDHMHEAFNKLSKEEQNDVQERLKQALTEAYIGAKMAGKLPGGIERYVKELLDPKIPWQSQLMKYMKAHTEPNDFHYRKPHRKSYNYEIYMPGIKKENIEIENIVDTSGSIDDESYKEFVSEVYGMMRSLPSLKIYLSFCDIRIKEEHVLGKSDINKLLNMKPKGYGGTDLEVGFEEIKNKRRNSKVLIVFTDGETPISKTEKDWPFEVIWVISKTGMTIEQAKRNLKYGRIIKMV